MVDLTGLPELGLDQKSCNSNSLPWAVPWTD